NRARDKQRLKRGGHRRRVELDGAEIACDADGLDLLALDEALDRLTAEQPSCAELVKLRFFAGLTQEQSAQALGVTGRTAGRYWAYAPAWLFQALDQGDHEHSGES